MSLVFPHVDKTSEYTKFRHKFYLTNQKNDHTFVAFLEYGDCYATPPEHWDRLKTMITQLPHYVLPDIVCNVASLTKYDCCKEHRELNELFTEKIKKIAQT